MFWETFGLRHRPFRSSPDPESYYPATTHEYALAAIREGLDDDEAIQLLTAEPGLGKTLLLQRLTERLPESARLAFVTLAPLGSRRDLFAALAFDLELPHEGRGETELRLAFIDSCLQHFARGGRTVLILDEAQHLSAELLEELRLLANLEGREGRAIQVILVGLPSLRERLQLPGLRALAQRIQVAVTLTPLEANEAADYLMHQIRASGGRPEQLFTAEALEIITTQLSGIPRLLNQVGHTCLKLAAQAGVKEVDAEVAMQALEQRLATFPDSAAGSINQSDEPSESGSRGGTRLDDPPIRRLYHGAHQPVA